MLTHLDPGAAGAEAQADGTADSSAGSGSGPAVPSKTVKSAAAINLDSDLEEDIAPVEQTASPSAGSSGASAAQTPGSPAKQTATATSDGKAAKAGPSSAGKKKDASPDSKQKSITSFFRKIPQAPADTVVAMASSSSSSAPPPVKATASTAMDVDKKKETPKSAPPTAENKPAPAASSAGPSGVKPVAKKSDKPAKAAKPAKADKPKDAKRKSSKDSEKENKKAANSDDEGSDDASAAGPSNSRKRRASAKQAPASKKARAESVSDDDVSDGDDSEESDEEMDSGSDFAANSGGSSESLSQSEEEASESDVETPSESDSDAPVQRRKSGGKKPRHVIASSSEEDEPVVVKKQDKGKGKEKAVEVKQEKKKPAVKKPAAAKKPAKQAKGSDEDEEEEEEEEEEDDEAAAAEEGASPQLSGDEEGGPKSKKVDIRPPGVEITFRSEEQVEAEWAAKAPVATDDVDMEDAEAGAATASSSSKPKAAAAVPVAVKKQTKLKVEKKTGSDDEEAEEGEEGAGEATGKSVITKNLPPLRTPYEHIADQVKRLNTDERPLLAKAVAKLGGKPLRVATMCSGTEAPIIALQKVCKALHVEFNIDFKYEDVFACEIEPFKQAYIERNFRPPILFRDVRELGNDMAHTAYGARVPVPGNVHMLIAGTSCVDYSGLNVKQKTLEDGGESGATFMGMLRWVRRHKPAIVLLENVSGAPWTDEMQKKAAERAKKSGKKMNVGPSIEEYFRREGYHGSFIRVDTKEFSIPHTRVRGYFMATQVQGLSEKWREDISLLKRGWTLPMDAYFLKPDHPDFIKGHAYLASKNKNEDGKGGRNSRTDWSRCESRHARARLDEMLGNKRPLTAWKEAGVTRGLDFTWNDWFSAQTERVTDLLDINMIREAMEGIDPNYKSYLWNVSQNVDRSTASGHIGLSPCLTPAMIPYLSARGGPATGREALALQGIDYMDLHLTVETEDQLADLAGNAMSTTVVSAAMLTALITAKDLLPGITSESKDGQVEQARPKVDVVETEGLVEGKIDIAAAKPAPISDLVQKAHLSSQRCNCEAGNQPALGEILQCVACLTTVCHHCGGRPEHLHCSFTGAALTEEDWLSQKGVVSAPAADQESASDDGAAEAEAEPVPVPMPAANAVNRVSAKAFEIDLKSIVPMTIRLSGLSKSDLESLKEAVGGRNISSSDWELWANAVAKIQGSTLYYSSLTRGNTWVASYESPFARLELRLHPSQPEWLLFGVPHKDLAVGHRLRALFKNPVARMRLDLSQSDVMSGKWEVDLPAKGDYKVQLEGCGELVETWQAGLGIEHPRWKDSKRWSQWKITVAPEVEAELDRPISGTYVLLDKCGTSQNSLHRKLASDSDRQMPPLYFFHAPDLTGPLSEDAFVFSTDVAKGGFQYFRPVVASVDASWRTNDADGANQIALVVEGRWIQAPRLSFDTKELASSTVNYKMADKLSTSIARSTCEHSQTVVSCDFPLPAATGDATDDLFKHTEWHEVDLTREASSTFPKLAWIISRLPEIAISGEAQGTVTDCPMCAPKPPTIQWIRTGKGFAPVEDAAQATDYEIAIKNRPAPFVVQLRADPATNTGYLRVALNTSSLAHQALATLPPRPVTEPLRVQWKLAQDYTSEFDHAKRMFTLRSNKADDEHGRIDDFRIPLRKEQSRSLTWMLAQEKFEDKFKFQEKEVIEGDLPAFGFRVEAQATRMVEARGGVIADQVGYGKTAISIGLICETRKEQLPVVDKDLIPLKATLVVVPGHLTKQWRSEFDKFVKSKILNIVEITTVNHLTNKSVKDLQEADVIITSATLLNSAVYWKRLTHFAAHPVDLPEDKNGGRMFKDILQATMDSLRQQTVRIKDGKIDEAITAIAQAKKEAAALAAENAKKAEEEAAKGRKKGKEVKAPKVKKQKAAPEIKTNLGDKAVKDSHRQLKGAPLQMFHFKRVIIDEFTYLKGREHVALLDLKASSRWILSGTPPVEDFGAIKGIAAHLGIHLGIDDDRQVPGAKVAKGDKTDAERFHGFREVHSKAWHATRDDVAQAFLDQYVRQNLAEIDTIPHRLLLHWLNLPTAERVLYLELMHHLQSLEMQAKGPKTYKDVSLGDRAERLLKVLEGSKDAEEALLKRAAHFAPGVKLAAESAVKACEDIAKIREEQRLACQKDLAREIAYAHQLATKIELLGGYPVDPKDTVGKRPPIEEFCRAIFAFRLSGDRFADRLIAEILERQGFEPTGELKHNMPGVTVSRSDKIDDVVYELRERVVTLRKVSKELAGRCRSLRFFEVIKKIQRGGADRESVNASCLCEHKDAELGVLSCCGHVACLDCLQYFATRQRCVHENNVCAAPVRVTNIVRNSLLSAAGADKASGKFGAKLQRLVDIVKRIPEDERCLIFVQFDDMFVKVEEALEAEGIACATLAKGTAGKKSSTLQDFQDPKSKHRVLLLNVGDSTASGANLTVANHIIFLSPLKAPTQASYDATETQAIGRAVRFGQTKPMVHIHRLFAWDTVDVDILKKRRPNLDLTFESKRRWNEEKKDWVPIADGDAEDENENESQNRAGPVEQRAEKDKDENVVMVD